MDWLASGFLWNGLGQRSFAFVIGNWYAVYALWIGALISIWVHTHRAWEVQVAKLHSYRLQPRVRLLLCLSGFTTFHILTWRMKRNVQFRQWWWKKQIFLNAIFFGQATFSHSGFKSFGKYWLGFIVYLTRKDSRVKDTPALAYDNSLKNEEICDN